MRESGDSEHAVDPLRRTAGAVGLHMLDYKPVLHCNNGATSKSTTALVTMSWLGLRASYSRPRVDDDNAFVEALFHTAQYRPQFRANGFMDLEHAREWACSFVQWYNHDHRHSAILYVSPGQRHAGEDHAVLQVRDRAVSAGAGRKPAALGTAYAKLESDHRRYAQPRARCDDQGSNGARS